METSSPFPSGRPSFIMLDILYLLTTLAFFGALGLLVRAVEKL
ncbi:MAG: hypothetical protein ABWX89_09950 [Paeniglutamicibacter terrestris]